MQTFATATPSLPTRQLVSAKELAAYLGVAVQTIYDWRDSGRLIQPIRVGPKCLRWELAKVLAALGMDAGEVAAHAS